ncbi:acyl-CoA synthetase family member 2, mitochondrial [Trichonephila clavipes]|nr:acyl-CoA synthetase family member 2, mitochondrial [Trichonephila clavipes]
MSQQKYAGETAPNASTIRRLVQRFRDTGSVADRKQSGRASIVKTKVADVDTALQSPMKRPYVYINIITEFISLLNSDERYLGCSRTAQRVTHHGTNYHTHLEEEYAKYRKSPDGKEVRLFTSTLKAVQCNIRTVMAQRKRLDDFLRGRIIGRLECGRTQLEVSEELGIAQSVISRLWQRFQDNGNVSRCYSTGHPRVTTLNEDRYLEVTAKRNRRSTASDLSRQLSSATGSFKVYRVQTLRAHWSKCS